MPGGALARLAEASVGQAEEMVAKPLEEEKDGGVEELFLPERVAGEVRDRDAGSKVERRYARVGTTRGSV